MTDDHDSNPDDADCCVVPVGTRITLPRLIDDCHHHFRDDDNLTTLVLSHATARCSRCC
jgi:hypothetical protein